MAHSTRLWVAVAALSLAVSGLAHAQGNTTGSLTGTLTDASGGVLPGATVTLSGPNIQGTRTDTTDAQGTYNFRNLPPGGDYKLTAQLSGFRDSTQEGIQVSLGQEGTVNLAMAPAGVTEQVDRHRASRHCSMSPDVDRRQHHVQPFETLPSTRGFQQLTTMAPGVTLEMGDHDRRFEHSPSVAASSAPENNYIIDGLSVDRSAIRHVRRQPHDELRAGGAGVDRRLPGGVWPIDGRRLQRHHQVGGQHLPRRSLQLQPGKSWTPADVERRREQGVDHVRRPQSPATTSVARSAGRS